MAATNNARDIFLAALDRPPADRAAYLDEACGGDAALRQRVEALLRAHDEPGAFLSEARPGVTGDATGTFGGADPGAASPTADFPGADGRAAAEPTADYPGRDERVGSVLAGKYKLIEEIGEGGMGSVYMAQQTEPVRRAVAVKVIKAGMDSRAVLARFEAERQALAMMDHPNIARVLDAGTTGGGRPFFVMELVKGTPITQYCDEKKLTPRERLELFVPVCLAIQHAHQKGIIHRDIKPSNVLVAQYDDRPVPKVIDFGVAKAAGQPLTDKTLMTGFGAVVGTPEYMSPEQASFNQLDVDTRSDVYALGVLLYELLAGSPPFGRADLERAGLLEVLRVIREQEPPRPSARLSTSAALASLAAVRGTDPGRLAALVRGELDWIVMRALEKDRTRRYDTAAGFAADVGRYLVGETVLAVPPSVGYRVRTFVRRNRAAVFASAAVLIAVLAGAGTATWQAVRATRAEGDARESAEHARDERANAEAARAAADEQRADAERRRRTTDRVLDFFERRVLTAGRPKADGGLGPGVTLLAALDAAEREVSAAFAGEPAVEVRVLVALVETYTQLGQYDRAERLRTRARNLLAADAGRALGPDEQLQRLSDEFTLAGVGMERLAAGLGEDSLALFAWRAELPPAEIESKLSELVDSIRPGSGGGGLPLAHLLRNRGLVRLRMGAYRQAGKDFRECLSILDGLGRNDWVAGAARVGAGAALLGLREYAEAEPLLVAGYDMLRAHAADIPSVARGELPDAADWLAELYTRWGKPDAVAKWRAERGKYPAGRAPPPREKR